MPVHALRAPLAAFGLMASQGLARVEWRVATSEEEEVVLRELAVVARLNYTRAKIRQLEAKLAKWRRNNPAGKLRATVPGAGIMGASAIAATIAGPGLFRSRRAFAA